ncbi:helix-turn-helix transcriptional regulator [Microbulbifer pacificus]|uniref:AlpA family phage regulatory protein n=1 Tax=Microbulbifer pacificus TaxID=407164 RepID=A0AAU0N1R1_9GAMM|nr:AlpA family phage regulatory protein [Microbulbifer pacificus]WOX05969.1 AlpA family phage regulatory protein [Microbulbifer pacificus]
MDNGEDEKGEKNNESPVDAFFLQHPERLVRLPEVLRLVGVSRSTWHRWIIAGKAPRPVKFFTGGSAWRYRDIMAFLEAPADYIAVEEEEPTLEE